MKKILLLAIVSIFCLNANAQKPYLLPPLGYSYDALEPYVDSMTMYIHYNKHHAAYVANLNKALENSPLATLKIEELMLNMSKANMAIRNNGGGHYNHSLFWEILKPSEGNNEQLIGPALSMEIAKQFGTLDQLKLQMADSAAKRFGSGWAWLYVTPAGRLSICTTPNQDNPLMDVSPIRGIPVLGIDVWEHAYYLKYQNKRADYLSAIWKVVNWFEVNNKYEAAVKSPLLRKIANKK